MDDELDMLESELKRLRPAAPPRALANRVAGELAERRRPRWRSPWVCALVVPAAAAVALIIARIGTTAEPPAAPGMAAIAPTAAEAETGFKPVAFENVLYSAQDEGIVTLADGTAARRERLRYMDTITWRNSRTNASLKWTVPREEVRVVPVALQ